MSFPIVVVKNLPYGALSERLFELLAPYGRIHQLRVPQKGALVPAGTCYVVYWTAADAQQAAKRLNGINFEGRYLVAAMHSVDRGGLRQEELEARAAALERVKEANPRAR